MWLWFRCFREDSDHAVRVSSSVVRVSRNPFKPIVIQYVFENVPVAWTFHVFSSPTTENPCISELADLKADSEIDQGMLKECLRKSQPRRTSTRPGPKSRSEMCSLWGRPGARKSNEFKGFCSFLASQWDPVLGSFLDPWTSNAFADSWETCRELI